jgi:hypothetical protein
MAELAQELESTQASLTATHVKLTSKSSSLDTTVIQEQHVKIQLMKAEEKLKVAEEQLKTQRQKLSERELSSSMVISSAVANAAALFKNDLSDLDVEILHKDFTIDDAEWETLANSAYDAAHDFVSLYDFSSLAESDRNNSPRAL